MTGAELKALLFKTPTRDAPVRPQPDWLSIDQEIKRNGVTFVLLLKVSKRAHPDGYRYSRFCDYNRSWSKQPEVTVPKEHPAGHCLFVDYAGQEMIVFDPTYGKERRGEIFVAALGFSNPLCIYFLGHFRIGVSELRDQLMVRRARLELNVTPNVIPFLS